MIQVTLQDSKLQHLTTSRTELKVKNWCFANIANGCGLRYTLQETHISKKSETRSNLDSIVKCIQSLLWSKKSSRTSNRRKNSETRSSLPKRRTPTLLLSDSESQSSADESDAVHSAESELMRYHEETPIPETEDPLICWKLNPSFSCSRQFCADNSLCTGNICSMRKTVQFYRVYHQQNEILSASRKCKRCGLFEWLAKVISTCLI